MKLQDLSVAEILPILSDKGVSNLYHANSLLTTNTFLTTGHLLSRSYVEENNLKQTPQYTDTSDKKYEIYNSIFLDFVDIHARARRRNHYGPVLFVFPVDFLFKAGIESVHITKRNPSKWSDADDVTSRYYMSPEEFRLGYSNGNFGSMLILPETARLSLLGHLDHVCFDNPRLIWNDNKRDICEEAIENSKTAAKEGGLSGKGIGIIKRTCDFHFCICQNQYKASPKTEEIYRIKR